MKIELSIIIITFNRAQYLKKALNQICKFKREICSWELIIIDNNSSDNTKDVVESFKELMEIRYVIEYNQGSSFTRNRGYLEAKNNWIVYLDDDEVPFDNFLERVIYVIESDKFDAWGGIDIPYFPEGRPVWLKSKYVKTRLPYKKLSILSNKNHFFSGGAMVLKREDLIKVSGFNLNTGMIGSLPGYGEETEVQIKLRKLGKNLGYDPELKFYHAILPYKLNLEWFFKYSFAIGRDNIETYNIKPTFLNIFIQLSIGFIQMVLLFFLKAPMLLSSSYFIENFIIDVFRKFSKRLGTAYFLLKGITQNRKWVKDVNSETIIL